MAEKWDKQLMEFLKRTGDELKRSGEELKVEAQRLLVEVKDPAKQAKVKEGLVNLRTWAVATGKQAAERIETAVRHVEETVEGAFEGKGPSTPVEPPRPKPAPSAPSAPAEPQRAPPAKKKSIGRKKTAATKAPAKAPAKKAAAKTGTKKSLGRKKPASRPST